MTTLRKNHQKPKKVICLVAALRSATAPDAIGNAWLGQQCGIDVAVDARDRQVHRADVEPAQLALAAEHRRGFPLPFREGEAEEGGSHDQMGVEVVPQEVARADHRAQVALAAELPHGVQAPAERHRASADKGVAAG